MVDTAQPTSVKRGTMTSVTWWAVNIAPSAERRVQELGRRRRSCWKQRKEGACVLRRKPSSAIGKYLKNEGINFNAFLGFCQKFWLHI